MKTVKRRFKNEIKIKKRTCSGNLHLYVESLRAHFLAYHRTNHNRYLATHYIDLLALENTHPHIFNNFQKGTFSVQISEKSTFGPLSADKMIETTINRDNKIPRRTTGEKSFNEASLGFLNNLFHLLIDKFCIIPQRFFSGDFNG